MLPPIKFEKTFFDFTVYLPQKVYIMIVDAAPEQESGRHE